MELPIFTIQSLSAHCFMKVACWVLGYAEEEHVVVPLCNESFHYFNQQFPSKTTTLIIAQQVDLVEFAGIIRNVGMVIRLSFCKANEFARGIFDYQYK